ncbi:MAG: glycosyltransferase family 39 protein [Nitrospinae bacterium]|nr:glycosyltransferase family 39 protein [Nitrospinota bacterium]
MVGYLKAKKFSLVIALLMIFTLLASMWGVYNISIQDGVMFTIDEKGGAVEKAFYYGSGNINPCVSGVGLIHGSLYGYLLFFFFCVYFVLGKLYGLFSSTADFAIQFYKDPWAFYLIARYFSGITACLTVLFLYKAAKLFFNDNGKATICASLLAFNFLFIQFAHIAKPDIPQTFLITVSLYFIIKAYQSNIRKNWLFATLCCSLAICTKMNSIVILLPLLLANIFSYYKEKTLLSVYIKDIFAPQVIVLVLSYLLLTPFIVFDFNTCFGTVIEQLNAGFKNAVAPAYFQRGGFFYLVEVLNESLGTPLFLLSLVGIIVSFLQKNKEGMILSSFPLVYFLIIGNSIYLDPNYILLTFPFLMILSVYSLYMFISYMNKKENQILALGIMVFIIVFPQILSMYSFNKKISGESTYFAAKKWVEGNLSQGSVILMDKLNSPNLAQNLENVTQTILKGSRDVGHLKGNSLTYRLKALPSKTYDIRLMKIDYSGQEDVYIDGIEELTVANLKSAGIQFIILAGLNSLVYKVYDPHYLYNVPKYKETLKKSSVFFREIEEKGTLLKIFNEKEPELFGATVKIFQIR